MDVNKVTLLGNLIKDPEARKLPSGQSLAFFGLATNYSWKDIKTKEKKDSVEFHNIIAWGKLADIIEKYLRKGSRIYVEGKLRHKCWKDKDGKFQNKTEIIADNLIMLGNRAEKNHKENGPKELAKEEVNLEEVEF